MNTVYDPQQISCRHDDNGDTAASKKEQQGCPFKTQLTRDSGRNAYSKSTRDPWMYEIILQYLQIYLLSHYPHQGMLATFLLKLIRLIEGQAANLPPYLSHKRAAFGENFCAAGQVILGEWDEVQRALTSPQARTFNLGTAPLSEERLPKAKGESSFLLTLSQKGAGGDGRWEAYNKAFYKYIIKDASARQDDPVAQSLMDQLVEDYKTMSHDRGGDFFNKNNEGGLFPFLNKYLHYCLMGIDPNDEETVDTLYSFFYGGVPPALYWLRTLGYAYERKDKSFIASLREVEKIYENSEVLKSFVISSEVNGISKRQMADLIVPIMGIAATQGPKHLLLTALGELSIPEYKEGVDTSKIKQTEFWDKIDLDDGKEVQNYLFECGRLNQPVGHTHRVALEDFTVEMMGKKRTFPKGTTISIPINMSCVNKNVYGESVFEFDPNRDNLRETSTIFHSVGERHAGRICPGGRFAMRMMTEILQKIGKSRRE